MTDKNSEITAAVVRERSRLGSFIRRRVRDPGDAEDILQDVLPALDADPEAALARSVVLE